MKLKLPKKPILLMSFTFLMSSIIANSGSISKPFSFTSGTVISSSQINSNFDQLFNEVNSKDTRIGTLETALTTITTIPLNTITANLTVTTSHNVILCDATGGAITITLPNATTVLGKKWSMKKIDASANLCTINTSGGNIDGQATKTMGTQYETREVISDGTNYYQISTNLNTPTVLTGTSNTTQVGAFGGDIIYASITVTITAGTWLIFGTAQLWTTDVPDSLQLGLYNNTDAAAVAGSKSGVGAVVAANTTSLNFSTVAIVTVTANKDIRLIGYRNGGSTLSMGCGTCTLTEGGRITAVKIY